MPPHIPVLTTGKMQKQMVRHCR